MRTLHSLILIILCFLPFVNFAQSFQPEILINEIGFNSGTNDEFIELLVLEPDVNLAGWRFDNFEDNEIKDIGYIELASDFPVLPQGTPILIYNDDSYFSDIVSAVNGQLNANGFFQVPFSSSLILKVKYVQNRSSDLDNWENYISFNNPRNGLFAWDPNNNPRAQITWGMQPDASNATNGFIATSSLGGIDESITAFQFLSPCAPELPDVYPLIESNGGGYLESQKDYTPGRANNTINGSIINNIQNGVPAISILKIECEMIQMEDPDMNNGRLQVTIERGLGPYTVVLNGPTSVPEWTTSDNVFTIDNLASGSYNVIVTDAGGCTSDCSQFITQSIDTSEPCGETEASVGRALTAEECGFKWVPTDGLVSPKNSISEVDLEPGEERTYELHISDGEGGIESIEEYTVSIADEIDIDLNSTSTIYCGQNITINAEAEGSDLTYSWSSIPSIILGNTSLPSVELHASELDPISSYNDRIILTVTVSNTSGCETDASIYIPIYPELALTIYGDENICANENTILTASSGYASYSWNTGASGQSISVQGGSYSVTATNAEGCAQEATFEVIQSNSGDGDNDGFCADDEPNDDDPCDPGMSLTVSGNTDVCQGERSPLSLSIENGMEPFSVQWTFQWTIAGGGSGQTLTIDNQNIVSIYKPYDSWSLIVTDANNCQSTESGTIQYINSADSDGDGYCDDVDCDINDFNATIDTDGDGICDVYDCDPNDVLGFVDSDGDGVCDNIDCESLNPYVAPGMPCNDGDNCTSNDRFDLNCTCMGTVVPDCEECLEGSPCDDANPCTFQDQYNSNCDCIGTFLDDCNLCEIGAPCDDNNQCTENDVFVEFCACAGTQILDCEDCVVGTSCDDGDPCTMDDILDANCNCAGDVSFDFIVSTQRLGTCLERAYELTVPSNFPLYSWSFDGEAIGRLPTIIVYEPGYYTIEITDENGCTNSKIKLLEDAINTDNSIITSPQTSLCNSNDPVTLEVNSNYINISWLDPQGESLGNNASITVSVPGEYTVNVESETGCQIKGTRKVTFAPFQIEFEKNHPTLCGALDETPITVTGYPDNSTFEWSHSDPNNSVNSAITAEVTVDQVGTYTVTVTDENECTAINSIEVKPINEANVEEILISEGFEKIKIEIQGLGLDGSNGSRARSVIDCEIDVSEAQEYIINKLQDPYPEIEPNGTELIQEYLQRVIEPHCTCDKEVDGLYMTDLCQNVEHDIQWFLDHVLRSENQSVQAYVVEESEVDGDSYLFLRKNLIPNCAFVSDNTNVNDEYSLALNEILCAIPSNENIILSRGVEGVLNISSKVPIFDGNVYSSPLESWGAVMNNYRKGKELKISGMSVTPVSEWCWTTGFVPGQPITPDMIIEGDFIEISIPYNETCYGKLKLTVDDENGLGSEFRNLFSPISLLGKVQEVVDNLLVQNYPLVNGEIPLCLVGENDFCNVFNVAANTSTNNPELLLAKRNTLLHFLSTKSQSQAEIIIDCFRDNNLVKPFRVEIFDSYFYKVDFLKELVRLFYLSGKEYQVVPEQFEDLRLERANDLTISSLDYFDYDNEYKLESFHLKKYYNTLGLGNVPSINRNKNFEESYSYFDTYTIRIADEYNFYGFDYDELGELAEAKVPGLLIAACQEIYDKNQTDSQIAILLNTAALAVGWGELSALVRAQRLLSLEAAFVVTDISSASVGLFLEMSPFCNGVESMPEDFCKTLQGLTLAIDALSLSGAYLSSSITSKKLKDAQDHWNSFEPSLKQTIEGDMEPADFQAFKILMDANIFGWLQRLSDEFDLIAAIGTENIFIEFLSNANFASNANKLLDLKDAIKTLDGTSNSGSNGYKFINDLVSSHPDLSKIGGDLSKMTSGQTGAYEVCIIDDVIRTNREKLTKVSNYLDNNPNVEAAFKAEFDATPANKRGLFVDRTSHIDDLRQQYGPFNTSANFKSKGLTSINQNVYDDMLNEYPTSLPNREEILDRVIKTGSTTPAKVVYQQGDELYKVVPKGESVGPNSPYWMTLGELNSLKTSGGLEQKLGLPLDSHGVKYDVYKISANQNSNVYQSTVAKTIESGYPTVGGASQSLVLKRFNWSSPSKVDEIIPEL